MKYKIVLIDFPFAEKSTTKLRPALCLTEPSKYADCIVAAISSKVAESLLVTDILIEEENRYFKKTGLKVSSMIRLDKMTTVHISKIKRELGMLPEELQKELKEKLVQLFDL